MKYYEILREKYDIQKRGEKTVKFYVDFRKKVHVKL